MKFFPSLILLLLLLAVPAGAAAGDIEQAELPAPPPATSVLFTASAAGLDDDLWDGLNFAAWQQAVQALPPAVASPTMRELLQAALMAEVAAPAEADAAALALQQMSAAARYAPAESVMALIASLPAPQQTAALRALQQNLALTGDLTSVCAASDAMQAADVKILCLLQAGKAESAQLQLDVLREAGGDAAFIEFAQQVILGIEKPKLPPALTVLQLRLLGTNPNLPLGDATSDAADALAARAKNYILSQRRGSAAPAAAEYLAGNGLADAGVISKAYQQVTFSAAELAAPATTANRLQGAMLRAFLWQQLNASRQSAAQAQLLSNYVAEAGAAGISGARGEGLRPLLLAVQPATQTMWAAPAFYTLAVAQGDSTIAAAWHRAAANFRQQVPEAAGWYVRIYPLALLQGQAEAGMLASWVTQAAALPNEGKLPLVEILQVLEASGVAVSPDIWQVASTSSGAGLSTQADAALLAKLQAAAKAGQQGAVILYSSALLGADPASAPVASLKQVYEALRAVGLGDYADRLLVEAMLNLLWPSS